MPRARRITRRLFPPSLRAKRSNPDCLCGGGLDCFVADAPRNDEDFRVKAVAMDIAPLILLAAGGTGGHLFPAEALGVELIKRGLRVRLVTDDRALHYSGLFSKDMIDVV